MKKILLLVLMLFINLMVFSQDNTNDKKPVKKELNGWDLFSAGRYRESILFLENEKKTFPDRINIYIIEGWDYRELKDYVSMEKISLEGLKIQPNDNRLLRNLAESYYYQKRFAEAATNFEKYLKFKFTWTELYIPYAYYYLGVCYMNANQLKRADVALAASNHYQPKNYNTIILMAEVKEKLGEFKNANNLFTLALQLQTTSQRALDGVNRTKEKIQ